MKGLHDAVELRGVVVEAAGQRHDGPVVRVERDDGALGFRHLREQRFALAGRQHVDDVADLEHVARRLRRHVARSRPADALHAEAVAHAAARDHGRLFRAGAHDDRGNQAADHRSRLDEAREFLVAALADLDAPDRATPAVAPVVLEHRAPQRHVRGALQAAVHGRDDLEAVGIDALAELLEQHEAHHLADVRRLDLHARAVKPARDGLVHRHLPGGLVEVAELAHAPQHVGATVRRLLDAGDRILARWRLQDAGEQRRLGGVDLGERLAEIGLGGGRETVGSLAEELRVHEQRENLLLGQLVLEREREEHLAELPPQLLLLRDERRADELLRQRAAALRGLHRGRGDDQCARDALPVDARVLEEAVVLGGEHRLHHDRRDLRPGHRHAPLLAELREQLAVAAVHAQRHLQAHVAQHRDVGKRRLQVVIGREECEPDEPRERNDDCGRDAQPSIQGRDHRDRLCIVMSADAGAGVACPRRRDRDARHGRTSRSSAASLRDPAPEARGRERPVRTVRPGDEEAPDEPRGPSSTGPNAGELRAGSRSI
jgi:hypothetical protein